MRKFVLAAAMVAAMPIAAHAADAEAGKAVFGKCKACHQTGPGAKNAVGPHLDGVLGRKAGSAEGFKYSEALANSGITWDEANLHEWLKDPKKKVPGNKMVFMGLKDDADVDNLIAFLKTDGK
ncbi:MAG TPA: cytochrome c family protein [Hyphomicrobium sp.]|nr:cytochrome c family protein [Hyphomicrobium sp.]